MTLEEDSVNKEHNVEYVSIALLIVRPVLCTDRDTGVPQVDCGSFQMAWRSRHAYTISLFKKPPPI